MDGQSKSATLKSTRSPSGAIGAPLDPETCLLIRAATGGEKTAQLKLLTLSEGLTMVSYCVVLYILIVLCGIVIRKS